MNLKKLKKQMKKINNQTANKIKNSINEFNIFKKYQDELFFRAVLYNFDEEKIVLVDLNESGFKGLYEKYFYSFINFATHLKVRIQNEDYKRKVFIINRDYYLDPKEISIEEQLAHILNQIKEFDFKQILLPGYKIIEIQTYFGFDLYDMKKYVPQEDEDNFISCEIELISFYLIEDLF